MQWSSLPEMPCSLLKLKRLSPQIDVGLSRGQWLTCVIPKTGEDQRADPAFITQSAVRILGLPETLQMQEKIRSVVLPGGLTPSPHGLPPWQEGPK